MAATATTTSTSELTVSKLGDEPRLKRDDQALVRALSLHVRVATASQLATVLGKGRALTASSIKGRLQKLVSSGELEAFRVSSHPLIGLLHPIWIWGPGDPTPPFGAISYRLRS